MLRTTLSFFICALILSSVSCAKRPLLSGTTSSEQATQECHAYTEQGKHEKAIQCFEILKTRFGGSQAAFEADLEVADNYFDQKDYLLATENYLAFTKFHPTHEKIGYAYYRLGLCYLNQSPKAIDRDQQYYDEAIHYFGLAIDRIDPLNNDLHNRAREKLQEVRTRIAKRHFYIGRFYYKTGEYGAAIPRFQTILADYTDLGFDAKALYLMGDSWLHLRDKEKALEVLSVFEQHFPQSPYRMKLAKRIGVR